MKIRSRRLIRMLARCIALSSRMLFALVRPEVRPWIKGTSPYDAPGEKFIYCVWHDGILGAIFSGKCIQVAALVSQHEDGSYVADAMECVGIHPIRGSSNRGGTAALRQMMEAAKDVHITIATDGPQGPRRVVKEGIIFLASKTGRRIVPVAFAARTAWKPKGRWTDLVIPLPFTKAIAASGEFLAVPPSLNREQMQHYRDMLQRRMDDLQNRIDAEVVGKSSVPRNDSPVAVENVENADVRRAA